MSQKKIALKQKEIKVKSSSDEETNSEVESSSDEESDNESGEKSYKIASKQKEIKVKSSSDEETNSEVKSSSDEETNSEVKSSSDEETDNKEGKCFRVIDLCAGTGAFSHVFHKTGKCTTVYANDLCENSKNIYDLNFDIKLTLGDLCDIDTKAIPEHDILCAGFACQPFSIAGKQEGFNDIRSNIFWKILDIIKYHKPEVVFLENVKNLQSHDNGKTFKIIKENLEKLGYYVNYKVINTCEVSYLPQNRERIYIICFKDKKKYKKFNFIFQKTKHIELKDFLLKNVPSKYYYDERFKIWEKVKNDVIKSIDVNVLYQYRRFYVRENKSNVCPTLTANMGGGGHNVPILRDKKGIRKLVPKECFKLQGFPDTYKLPDIADSKLYKLAGNAVSIPVITIICNKILKVLE
jgi:DNA (cytosine-5)-methyltransferase 1